MWRIMASAVLVLFVVGCGDAGPTMKGSPKDRAARPPAAREPARDDAAGGKKKDEAPRKLIYTGRVSLITTDYEKAFDGIDELVKRLKGYVLKLDEYARPGTQRHANWTVRIPADRMDTFRAEVVRLGEPQANSLETQDITDQYADAEAELKDLALDEEAVRKLYDKKQAEKMADLIEVRRELSRVRSEINLRKDRIKRWDKLTEYATFTVELEERTTYTPEGSAPFGTRVGRAFTDSVQALVVFGQGVVLFLAVLAPWLPIPVVLGVVLYATLKRPRVPPPPPPSSPQPTEPGSPSTILPPS